MEKHKMQLGSTLKGMYLIMKNSIIKIVIFELIYKIIIFSVVKPIINLTIGFFVKISGHQVIINSDISPFFLSIPGFLMGIIVVTISVLIVYYEFSVIVLILRSAYDKKTMKISEAARKALYGFSSLKHISTLGFAVYTLVLMPVLNFGISSSLYSKFQIPKFIIDEIEKYGILGMLLMVVAILLGIYLFTQAFFVLPIMILERKNFFESVKESKNIIKGNKFKIFSLSIIVALLWVMIIIIFSFLYSIFTLNMVTLSLKIIFIILIAMVEIYTTPLLISVILVNYIPFESDEKTDYTDEKADNFIETMKQILFYIINRSVEIIKWIYEKTRKLFKENTMLMAIITGIVVIIASGITISYVTREKHVQTEIVVGHRGSKEGVENTTEAILSAARQGADYAEIDVFLSKDGVPMVIHDFNLLRLTGQMGNIWEYTAEELQRDFVQSQDGYTSKIETLDEVCKNVKDKIKLMVELKTHKKETESLVSKTIEVIKNNQMEENVLYHTLEYPLLEEMKIKNPKAKIGFIIISKVGALSTSVLSKMSPDFYGVEQTILTEKIVRACHNAGKPVYVWTVNEPEYVKELFSMGVDGIISDYPSMIIEAKNEYSEDIILLKSIRENTFIKNFL